MSAKMSFELDAGKILAKLHRGGCQTREGNAVFINTGITDDAHKLKPEEVDKAKINFDMEGGEYELGVMFVGMPPGKVDPKKLASAQGENAGAKKPEDMLKDAVAGVKAYLEKNKKDIGGLDDKEWKELYTGFQKSNKGNGKVPDEKEFRSKIEELVGGEGGKKDEKDEKTPITDNPDEKPANESFVFEDYTETDPNKNEIGMDIIGDMLTNLTVKKFKKIDAQAKKAPADAKKAIEQNSDIVKKAMETNMKFACQYLKDYLTAFAGSDAAKVQPSDVQVTYIPDKFADPYKVKKYDGYQIPALTDAETRQRKVEIIKGLKAKTLKEEDMFRNMCFKIAYTLDIGK